MAEYCASCNAEIYANHPKVIKMEFPRKHQANPDVIILRGYDYFCSWKCAEDYAHERARQSNT